MADEVASLLVRITADGSQAVGVLNGIQATVGTLADSNATMMNKIAASGALASKVGMTITKTVGVATVAGLTASAKAAGQLNKELANIGTLSVPTEKLKQYKGQIQDIAIAAGKSTSDIAEGTYQVVSAFGDSADTMEKVEINAKAARAGLATTADSINLTSAVTKAYGDTSAAATQKVADLAFKTVELGQTTFPELAQSMQQVTSLSKELGVSQEELFGAYATLTGVTGNAAEVQTQMKAIYTALLKPSENMTKAIKKQGYESGYSMIKTLGFAGTLDALKKATNGSEEEMLGLFNNVRAMPAVMALTGAQYDTFNTKLEKMKNAAGAATAAFEVQTEGIAKTGFTLEQAKIKMEVATQRFGESAAPIIGDFADVVDKVSDKLANMSDEERRAIINTGVLTTKIGVGLAVGGKVLTVGTKVIGTIKSISGVFSSGATAAGEATAETMALSEVGAHAASSISGIATAYGAVAAGAVAAAAPAALAAGIMVAGGAAVEAYYDKLETSGAKATEEAENYAKVSREAFNMSEAAKSVEDYTSRYNELKSIISTNNATDAEFAELKATEQWFIDNYGQFITAEEQKNGIRQTTIDLINQMAQADAKRAETERALARYDLYQNQNEYRKNAATAIDELPVVQNTLNGYKQRIEDAKNLTNELDVLQNKYNAINSNEGLTYKQRSEAVHQLTEDNQELFESYERLTGGKLYLPELESEIQNLSSLTGEWEGKLGPLEDRLSSLRQSVKDYGEALTILGGAATGEVLDDLGFGSILDLFQNGSGEQVDTAIENLSKKVKLLGFSSTETAAQVAYFKNGFNDLQSAIQSGALSAVVDDFIKRGQEVGLTTSEIISQAALLKNGFQNVTEALASNDSNAVNAILKDMAELGADSVEQIDAIAHAIGLIPENKHIEINAEGNYEVLAGAAEKLHEIDNENVHISVGADGDITILNQADGTVKNLQLNGAVSLGVNADGNIDVLDEAGNKLAEIKKDPSAKITVETELEEPESDVTVTTTADTDPAKTEIAKLNDEPVKVSVDANVDDADAKIKGLEQKVTVTVDYVATGAVPKAKGTMSFEGGLAKVNDQKGIADPRELIIDRGRAFIPEGRDVILPLSKGAKVYTAAQTKAIMSGAGIPHYATGKNNSDAFTAARDDWTHYTKTHAVTTAQELEKWLEFQEKYKKNEKDIWDIEEQVFSLRQKQYSEQVKASEQWLTHETKYNGLAVIEQLDAIDRIRKSVVAAYEVGLISHKEYLDTISSYDEKYIDKRKEQIAEIFDISKAYISDHTYFNDWDDNGDSPLEAYNRVKQDRLNELAASELTQKEYDEYMTSLGSDMYAERREQSERWLEEQRKYFNMSAEDYAAGIDRMKKYTQEYYDNGLISRREYNEAMTELRHMELDEAESAYEEMLANQSKHISEMRDKFSKQEQELRDSWTVADRKTDMATVQEQLKLYSGAVTDRGQQKYKELQEQMKQLRRDEELYNLQVANNATIESLDAEYAKLETDKAAVLAGIAKNTDIDVSGIVGTLTSNLDGYAGSITTLLQTLINTVNNKEINVPESTVYGPTYNDNRQITLTQMADILPYMGGFR